MSSKFFFRTFIAAAIFSAGSQSHATARQDGLPPKDYRDVYGIMWVGDPHSNLQFAKQMGYDYVMYQPGMENDELAADLGFYIESPEHSVYPVPRSLNRAKTYTAEEQELYEKYFAKKGSQPFPANMATGWFFSPDVFSVEPGYQNQEVIDTLVSRIIQLAKKLERKDRRFLLAGYAWDVPNLPGDFWDKMQTQGGKQITLAHWTGADSAYKPEGVTFQYATQSDGHAAFFRQLFKQTRAKFPEARFIMEPYRIWEEWLALVKDRPDVKDIMPDLILQECGATKWATGTEFATDARIFASGLIKGHGSVGSSTPDCFGEKPNREIAALAAVNGSYFGWFGRFGGTGDMPGFHNIREVPARLQLVRRVPAWDNRNGIPLGKRSWDGQVYSSPASHISESVIWSTHPKNGRLFAVWLKPDGVVRIPEGLKFVSIERADQLFMESASGLPDVEVKGNDLRLTDNQGIGRGYIITVAQSGESPTPSPAAPPASSVAFTQGVIDDMQKPDEGEQIGFKRARYAATQMGLMGRGDYTADYWKPADQSLKAATWWRAITPWWNVLPLVGNTATQTKVEIGTIVTMVRDRGTNHWRIIKSGQSSWAGLYNAPASVSYGSIAGVTATVNGYKSVTYALPAGSNTAHGGSGVVEVDPETIDGIIHCVAARVVGPDAAQARYAMWSGADWIPFKGWKMSAAAPMGWGPAVATGRLKPLTTSWTIFCMAPLDNPGHAGEDGNYINNDGAFMSAAGLLANPAPLPEGLLPE